MQEVVPRKPIVALLMSAVLPGFGQLYNGEVNRGIWLFIAYVTVNFPWLALLALYFPGGWLIPLLLLTLATALSIWIFGMVDAWRRAKVEQAYVPERWQCSGVYVLVFIVCNILTLPMLTGYIRAHQFQSFRIPSVSMEPSVLRGDFLVADMRYNCPGCKFRIEQGDIAIFAEPDDRTRLFIKRIIALPGDRVRIEGRTIQVNGQALTVGTPDAGAVEMTERSANGSEWSVQWDPSRFVPANMDVTVPPGEVFVLGDNRSASLDSRQFGTVPMQDVIGRARQIWFSYGADGIRWSRLGQRVD